jgi:cytochrome P450
MAGDATTETTALRDPHPTRALPHPRRRIPLLGDVFAMEVDAPSQSALRLARELGPLYELRVLGSRYVVAAGAEYVMDLNDETRFRKHLGPDMEALRVIGGDGLFTAYDGEPNWQAAHDVLMPAFSQAAMRRYHATMVDVAARMIRRWDALAAGGHTVDVSADTTNVTLETIGRCAAGYSFDVFERDDVHPFVRHMVAGLKGSDHLGALRASYLPQFLADRVEKRVARHGRAMAAVADDVIATRRAERARGRTAPDDLLDLMLDSDLDVANVRYQLLNFLVAGHETTSGALSFALYYLSREPEVFARARAEVDDVWGGDEPDFEQIAKLRYVRRVFDESLRLQPTVPGYYRAAREDTMLAGTYPMREGDWALALTAMLHRDPLWGPEPDRFDADRFAPDRVRARPAGLYKPFGTGARSCIGRQFALHEAILILGSLVRRYDLSADPGYTLAISERLTLMPKGFQLRLRRRSDQPSPA